MAGPTPQTESAEMGIQAVSTRTVALTVEFVRAQLPQLPERDVQPLVQAAAENNQQNFRALLRAAIPRADADATFGQFREWLELAGSVTESLERWNLARQRRDTEGMNREGRELGSAASRGVAMGVAGMPRIVLQEADNQLTDPQAREDFARAAVSYGFSPADVMSVFGDLGREEGGRTGDQASAFRAQLQTAAVERSRELMRRIQELQKELEEASDPASRRALANERTQMLTEYGRLTGRALATEVADQWMRNPDSPQTDSSGRRVMLSVEKMEQSVIDETQHVIDLHTGRLDRVRIVPGERFA